MNKKLDNLLSEIDKLKQKLDASRPLLNETILQAIDIEYTYNSNRIEGNTLTLRETDIVINKGLTIGGKSMREHLEAVNHYEAIAFIKELVTEGSILNENIIKDIHSLVLRGIDRENAGKYRSVPVSISGSRHEPPQPWQVPKLMEDLNFWIQEEAENLHPVIFAAEIHERIATIHPFIDGNGRTARLLMNLILLQNGYTIADISGDTKGRLAYYNALEKCNLNQDKTDFMVLITEYVYDSMGKLVKKLGQNHDQL
ncbi:MAG: Fic family protein [Thermodesulfobacteriota bacterium]|nr:Fic family protein [Thermodesulfobacteriota bacterium]